MAIKTNLTNLQPRREVYKKEIQLLSHGYTNPKAWPDGKIFVYPWDNEIDTWLMTQAREGAQKNSMLYAAASKLCNLNGGKIEEFVSAEIMTILLVAKAIPKKFDIKYIAKCPHCGAEEPGTILVPDELVKVGEKSHDYKGFDEITLPDCKDVVCIRPLLVRDELAIESREAALRESLPDDTARTLYAVTSVGGGKPDTLDEVRMWYDALPPSDSRFLEKKVIEVTPHLDKNLPHRCDSCKNKYFFPLTFDSEFFR